MRLPRMRFRRTQFDRGRCWVSQGLRGEVYRFNHRPCVPRIRWTNLLDAKRASGVFGRQSQRQAPKKLKCQQMVSVADFVVSTKGSALKWRRGPEATCSSLGFSGARLECLDSRDRQVCLITSPTISYTTPKASPRDEIGLLPPCVRTAWAFPATSKFRPPRNPYLAHSPRNITVVTYHGRKRQRRHYHVS